MSNLIREVNITKDQINRAKDLYDFYNIKNSFTKGHSQIYGALGEILVMDELHLDTNVNYIGTKDADLVIEGKKIDVKTKKTTSAPKPYFYNSVALNSLVQRCDAYYFLRINKSMNTGWFCGQITKKDFMTKGEYFIKGELDPLSKNGFTFKEDSMNVPIKDCNPIELNEINELFLRKNFNIIYSEGFFQSDYKQTPKGKVQILYLPQRQLLTLKFDFGTVFSKKIVKKQNFVNFFYEKTGFYIMI